MIISFTNVIGAIRSLGEAAQVITTNLKMWLGFETSQHLGLEQVVNGDFATDSDWSEGTGWDIDEANNKATHTGAGGIIKQTFSNLIVGKHYVASVTLNSVGDTTLSNTSFQIRNNTDTASVAQLLSSSGEILADEINYLTLNFTATQVNNIIRVYSADNIFVTDFSVKEITQITPDKSGNNNVGELFTGKALDFDAAGDYVDISGFSMSGNNATFAFWAYIRENIAGDYFFDFHSLSSRFILGFGQTSRKLAIYSNSGSGSWNDFGDPPQDQWVRIVLTVKGTTAKCFVDGVQLGTDKTISVYDFSSATTSRIGSRYLPFSGNEKWYDGILSDFQVYDKPWLNDDIAYDYANPQNLVTDSDNTTIALSNLKAYWAMSEGAGSLTYDSSGEGNNGTINGATYEPAQPRIPQLGMMNWAKSTPVADEIILIPNPNNTSQDIFGNAVRDRLNSFNLDGSGYAEVADDTDLDFGTGDFTLECWAKYDFLNQGSGFNILVSNGDMGGSGSGFNLGSSSSRFDFRLLSSAITKNFGTDNMTVGNWYHLVVTRDGTTLNLYRDTAIKSSSTIASVDVDTSLPVRIGRDTTTNRFYQNLISDVRLYDRALSSDEVENNYNAGLSAHTN